ncbi:MAG: DUF488 domain-containing protein [Verrucomicrobiales bacterium]|nr:DUF488 domain-containing protein [Verrucomicrobiales bacterium]
MKLPVYHRQRFILFLLEIAGGELSRMDLQKLIFLHEEEQNSGHFNFIPYHYGAYSFQCADDLDLLEKRGWISKEGEHNIGLVQSLPSDPRGNQVRSELREWLPSHKERGNNLVKYTYLNYPWFAQNSRMKDSLLSRKELNAIPNATTNEIPTVQSIGYEGISFEGYVNQLILNQTATLCDVRRNPLSRKFGFSKDSLARILPKIGIEYKHIPELGIISEKRRALDTRADYDELFAEYRESLPNRREALENLCEIVKHDGAVALTCFEADPTYCHRHCVTEWLETNKAFPVQHL